jgi:hypothetical protein
MEAITCQRCRCADLKAAQLCANLLDLQVGLWQFVEDLLPVVQSRRLQGQGVLSYLHVALVAHRKRLPAPLLLSGG